MDQVTFKALCEKTVRDTSAILVAKGEEYAGSQDRLANFKRGAQLTGATPLQVAFVYASKHYDSIATYIKKDAAGFEQRLSEPIEGRFDDLINYCILMKAIVAEQFEQQRAARAISQPKPVERHINREEVIQPLPKVYPELSTEAKFNRQT